LALPVGREERDVYSMLVSTLPFDCKEAEDLFDIIIRGQASCIMCVRSRELRVVARFDVTC